MKKNIVLSIIYIAFLYVASPALGGQLTVTAGKKNEKYEKVYFAGGCFWCMEESFDKINGVIKSVSGYSGGHTENPSYEDVIYKDTGHVEAIEITYNPKVLTYEKLLNVYWKNIKTYPTYVSTVSNRNCCTNDWNKSS